MTVYPPCQSTRNKSRFVLVSNQASIAGGQISLLAIAEIPIAFVLFWTLAINSSFPWQRSTALGLFSAFLFFALQGGARYRQFETWVLKNHQYELQNINALDLIRIF